MVTKTIHCRSFWQPFSIPKSLFLFCFCVYNYTSQIVRVILCSKQLTLSLSVIVVSMQLILLLFVYFLFCFRDGMIQKYVLTVCFWFVFFQLKIIPRQQRQPVSTVLVFLHLLLIYTFSLFNSTYRAPVC